jgi:hypothetical protein
MMDRVNLANELMAIPQTFTDLYTTKDYVEHVREEFRESMERSFNPELEGNDFDRCLFFRRFTEMPGPFLTQPCDYSSIDEEDVEIDLCYIIEHMTVYKRFIFGYFQMYINSMSCDYTAELLRDLIKATEGQSSEFREAAILVDRHIGYTYTATDLIGALAAYGRVTGIVDYYEGKHGR